MKKIGFLLFFMLLTGCTKSEEVLLLKCQKLRNYEYYNGTNVIGIYGIDKKATKVEMVENYTPKWDDVDNDTLKKQLEVAKQELEKTYKEVHFTVEEYRRDITSDMILPITEANKKIMQTDDNYASSFENGIFSIQLYKTLLEKNDYICE